jgi:hypothetical protein
MPAHAAVMTLGLPFRSNVPTHQTGAGNARIFAPKDFFIENLLTRELIGILLLWDSG